MDIKIMQKPDWVSWDDIHELLLEAHKKNIKNGIVLKNAQIQLLYQVIMNIYA